MPDTYSTDHLLGVLDAMDRTSTPLLDLFFPDQMEFDTEKIYLDKLADANRLAPFVSPNVEGRAMRARGFSTRDFQPPYLKPKHTVTPVNMLKRKAGERFSGELSPADRMDAAVADNLKIEEDTISRREEWMASALLRTGTVTASGDEHPAITIDLGRNASLTKALAGVNRWGQAGIFPFRNLATWATEVAQLSGAHPGTVVMDPLATAFLQQDTDFRALLDNRRQDGGQMQFLPLANGGIGEELVFVGRAGQFEFWQYSNTYVDDAGATQKYLPDNTVIMGSRTRAAGVRCYGAIQDVGAMRAMARFPKMWTMDDPSANVTMVQSAPLPILQRPDATLCATVN
jgi:Phage major capsid protein E